MDNVILVLLILLLAGLSCAAYFFLGGYNVAATQPHTDPVAWFLDKAQTNSVRMHAAKLDLPSLVNESRTQTGPGHYHEMCVTSHGAPGIQASDTGRGLYPKPPDLVESADEMSASQFFWIVKNGIKMTGMPACGPAHDDQSLWGIVAFLKKPPGISGDQYKQLVAAAGLQPDSSHEVTERHSHSSRNGVSGEEDHQLKELPEAETHNHDKHDHER